MIYNEFLRSHCIPKFQKSSVFGGEFSLILDELNSKHLRFMIELLQMILKPIFETAVELLSELKSLTFKSNSVL